MIDPIAASFAAIATRSPASVALVFAAGALTSLGPCVAPRYIAVAALANGRNPVGATLAFVAGLVGAFVSLGFVAGWLGTLWALSSSLYALLAGGLLSAGCILLVRADGPSPGHASGRAVAEPRSLGAVFLLGAAGALVISPCCTPVVASIVAASTAIGDPLTGMLLLLSFSLGHALPLFFAGYAGALVERLGRHYIPAQAFAIVGAVLMIALGAYYGVLA